MYFGGYKKRGTKNSNIKKKKKKKGTESFYLWRVISYRLLIQMYVFKRWEDKQPSERYGLEISK